MATRGRTGVLERRGRVERQGSNERTGPGAGLLRLQRMAGNAAAAGLLQRVMVQRADAGWADAAEQGHFWNAAMREVGNVRRYPLQLASGGFEGAGLDEASASLTTESAQHRAIALVPAGLDPTKPVTVLLHFHGHAETAGRPYASWREHKRTRQVRDVAHDQIAQQIEAAGDPQVLGVLPVGVGRSLFAKTYGSFAGGPYLDQVFQALADVGATASKISSAAARVVLGAHSGGWFTVRSMLEASMAQAAGGPVTGKSTAGLPIAGVALFEGHLDGGNWTTVRRWAYSHLDRLAALMDTNADPAVKEGAIRATPTLRAYYGRSYTESHRLLDEALRAWFNQPFKGDERRTNRQVLGGWYERVAALFRVVRVAGVGHEEIVRGHARTDTKAPYAGSVTDALKAVEDPTAGPIPELRTVAGPTTEQAAGATTTGTTPTTTGTTPTTTPPPRQAATGSSDVTITWGANARRDVVAETSIEVLKDVLRAAGLRKATITSTARTATDQARAMYQNLVTQGVDKQRALYGPAGDRVIDVYEQLRDAGKPAQEIRDGMRDAILAIGPSKVSRHCGDPAVLNVFDVGPRSLGDDTARRAFNDAAKAEEGKRVAKYIPYPKDPGNHFEIKPAGAPSAPAPTVPAPAPAPSTTEAPTEKPLETPAQAPAPTTTEAPAAPTTEAPAPGSTGTAAKARAWRAADATAQYALTEAERAVLPETAAERRADKVELAAKAKRLAQLRRKKKPSDAEKTELADLEALQTRVKAAAKDEAGGVLARAGFTVEGWYSQIVKGEFLGISLRVHKELAERFDKAQDKLVNDTAINPGGLPAAELGAQLGMYQSTSDLRPPKAAVGGSQLSLHTFGLAVDLNYAGNVFIGNKQVKGKRTPAKVAARTPRLVERAMWLLKGTAFDVETSNAVPRAPKDVGEAWERHREASDALVAYLALADDLESDAFADLVRRCPEPPKGVRWDQPASADWWNDVEWWKERVRKDVPLADEYDFSEQKHHGYAAKTGYMDLAKAVVVALVEAGLTWGGQYGRAKDMMHFDWRSGGDAKKIDLARAGREPEH